MARSIIEIYDSLNSVKANFQELQDYTTDPNNPYSIEDNFQSLKQDVNSTSRVAIWRLWIWIFAVGSWVIESLFDQHTAELNTILANKKPHNLRWYEEESKKFQYGYELTWIDDEYVYERIDEAAKIIKHVKASEKNGLVIIKVSKEVGGIKTPLSNGEKTAFTDFWAKYKDAGVKIQIVSQAADILKVDITIIRDRLVLAADNSLLRDSSILPIDAAIDQYADNLEYGGILRLSKFVDAIQSAEGVIDVKLNAAWWKPTGGAYASVGMSVESISGYFIVQKSDSTFIFNDSVNITVID